MNGQSNILENNLATLTREIQFIENIAGKYPVWSMTRHRIDDFLHDLRRERDNILELKKAKSVID